MDFLSYFNGVCHVVLFYGTDIPGSKSSDLDRSNNIIDNK